jgi:hypothetical protein
MPAKDCGLTVHGPAAGTVSQANGQHQIGRRDQLNYPEKSNAPRCQAIDPVMSIDPVDRMGDQASGDRANAPVKERCAPLTGTWRNISRVASTTGINGRTGFRIIAALSSPTCAIMLPKATIGSTMIGGYIIIFKNSTSQDSIAGRPPRGRQ